MLKVVRNLPDDEYRAKRCALCRWFLCRLFPPTEAPKSKTKAIIYCCTKICPKGEYKADEPKKSEAGDGEM